VRSVQRCPPADTNAHCSASRFHTARWTVRGTRRAVDAGLLSVAGRIVGRRGLAVRPSFSRSTFASSRVSARSKIAPGSPSGTSRRISAWSRRSLSWVSWAMVNCTRYRSGAVAWTSGRAGAGADGGGAGSGRSGATSAGTRIGAAAGTGGGSFRTVLGTSGRGASSATSLSISRTLRPRALSRTASWFSGVRCRARSRTAVKVNDPATRDSRITGKRPHARAACIFMRRMYHGRFSTLGRAAGGARSRAGCSVQRRAMTWLRDRPVCADGAREGRCGELMFTQAARAAKPRVRNFTVLKKVRRRRRGESQRLWDVDRQAGRRDEILRDCDPAGTIPPSVSRRMRPSWGRTTDGHDSSGKSGAGESGSPGRRRGSGGRVA
jgi:hypothetical protein